MNSIVVCFVLVLLLNLVVALQLSAMINELRRETEMLNEVDGCTIRKLKYLFDEVYQLRKNIEEIYHWLNENKEEIEELKENIYGNDEIHLMFEEEIEKLKAIQIQDTNALIRRMGEVERGNISLKSNFLILREAIMIVHEEVKKMKRKELLKTKTKFKKCRKFKNGKRLKKAFK